MSQPIRDQCGHLVFQIGTKNTNLVEDIEILLPVKFRQIPFSCFRGEVENVSANQKPGWPSYFSDQPEKHKLGRGRWDLASCQVSLNSVQLFQRRSRKCLSQSEARAAILFFRISWTNGAMHQWGGGGKQQEAKRATYRAPEYNVPPFWQIGQGGNLVFLICPKNTNLVEDVEIFLPVKFRCRP